MSTVLETRFEGVNADGEFVVTQWPAGDSDVSDYYVHKIAPIDPDRQDKHTLSDDCYCSPGIDMQAPKPNQVVWTYTHREVARSEPGQDAGQGGLDEGVETADEQGRPDAGGSTTSVSGEAELETGQLDPGSEPGLRTTTVEGIKLFNVHDPSSCAGEVCVIHNPLDHHMRDWPLGWRDDRKIFERHCPHGVGHPDPSQFEYWKRVGIQGGGVHMCDGCCAR